MTDTLHTGEFNPGIGWRGSGTAVSIFQDTVCVIGPGDGSNSKNLYISTFDVSKAATDWNVTDTSNWSSGQLRFNGDGSARPGASYRPPKSSATTCTCSGPRQCKPS